MNDIQRAAGTKICYLPYQVVKLEYYIQPASMLAHALYANLNRAHFIMLHPVAPPNKRDHITRRVKQSRSCPNSRNVLLVFLRVSLDRSRTRVGVLHLTLPYKDRFR